MSKTISTIKKGWWAFELPGYRSREGTYSLFSYEDLPPISTEPDGGFDYLKSNSVGDHSLFENVYPPDSSPDLSSLTNFASNVNLHLPSSFVTFMQSSDLHRRIRSCTNCYLDIGDFAVRTIGAVDGYLFHFLSDSQWVGHWYVHVDQHGNHFVATSIEPFGFEYNSDSGSSGKQSIDMASEEIWYCAPSFSEFIYRFWLENEIWIALEDRLRDLSPEESAYLKWYASKET